MSAESIVILSIVFFLFLCGAYYRYLCEREEKVYEVGTKPVLLLVLAAPVVWQYLLVGKGWQKLTGVIILAGLMSVWYIGFVRRKYWAGIAELKRVLFTYMMLVTAFSGVIIYTILPEPSEKLRTVQVVSVFLLGLSVAEGIGLWIRERKQKITGQLGTGEVAEAVNRAETVDGTEDDRATDGVEKARFGRREWLVLMGIMLSYGLVTFIGLGSRQMPQTEMEIRPDAEGSHEIILDLGTEQEIYSLYMHLGHMLDRLIAISYYDEVQGQWIPLQEEVKLDTNYNWNEIVIDREVRYLGIVSRNGKAVFHEIVLLDAEGERLLPVNADAYPLLFDEQDLFPKEVTYYYRTMFDEIYYAGSAYEFLNGMPMFETTHPPMGKILIAIGEWLFGVNPFGWRFSCAVFGMLMVPLMCWFLYRMFKDSRIALIGTALLSLDFMHYTLSRIATLDTIIAFFILAMFAFMWRVLELAEEEIAAGRTRPTVRMVLMMLVCALMTGMGVATKWTGFYAMAGIAVCFLWFIGYKLWSFKKQETGIMNGRLYAGWMLGEGVVLFGLIPLGIYVLAFLPQCLATGADNLWKVMWDSSLFMLNFHSDIVFEHPYESPWYTWAWMRTPLMDAANILGDERCSIIVTMGNPIIWWSGLAAVFHMLYRALFKKDRKAGYLVFAYLVMYAPWFFVKRTVFIYQYYGSSLFMIGMLAYSLYLFGIKRKKLIPVFLEVALFAFILFYPVISGYAVSGYHGVIYLEWLPSWKFAWI